MTKRLLLAALAALSFGTQFTADAFCASCRGGVCHIARKHANKKAQPKKQAKPRKQQVEKTQPKKKKVVAKKQAKPRKQQVKKTQPAAKKVQPKKAVKQSNNKTVNAAVLCAITCLNGIEREVNSVLPVIRESSFACFASKFQAEMAKVRAAKKKLQQALKTNR